MPLCHRQQQHAEAGENAYTNVAYMAYIARYSTFGKVLTLADMSLPGHFVKTAPGHPLQGNSLAALSHQGLHGLHREHVPDAGLEDQGLERLKTSLMSGCLRTCWLAEVDMPSSAPAPLAALSASASALSCHRRSPPCEPSSLPVPGKVGFT